MMSFTVVKLFTIFLVLDETSPFVNLVQDQGLNGVATMSASPANPAWTASKAIDGDTRQNYTLNSCAITDISHHYASVWWKVWLLRPFNIAYLEIYFRSDAYRNATGFSLYTYDTQVFNPPSDTKHLVYYHDPLSGCPASAMNITVNRVAQGVVFINMRPPGFTSSCQAADSLYTTIDICEVNVMGCNQNRYGVGCLSECSNKCKDQHCDAFNGSCIHGCSDPNALTLDCIVCSNGTYISSGMCVRCPGRCQGGAPCNKLTGRCDQGCEDKWTGQFCEDCIDGFYNRNCSGRCGSCVNDGVCDKISGHCTNGCQANYLQPLCQDCVPGFYGDDCETECGKCKNGAGCNQTSGLCPNGCRDHWVVPYCTDCEPYKYGPNCAFDCGHCKHDKPCSMDTGDCPSGCVDGWTGKHCLTVITDSDEQEKPEKPRFTTLSVVLIVLVIVLIGLVLFFIFDSKRRGSLQHATEKPSDISETENQYSPETEKESEDSQTTLALL
ncbi:laminin subunit beta-1 [Magallana gigas]|uniref:laminin subunit beta-1 n=1 Tax=Magallana gigas TaxID=29159 RepID=UPI00333FD01A